MVVSLSVPGTLSADTARTWNAQTGPLAPTWRRVDRSLAQSIPSRNGARRRVDDVPPEEGSAISSVAIRLDDVSKRFEGSENEAVSSLSLDIDAGSIVVFIGPSGCGKTTTLRMINRLIEPTSGSISINGEDITQRPVSDLRREIGYVIQQVGLFPHQTIAGNIATVPRMLGWDKERISSRIEELAELVGLEVAMLSRFPDELSGGQQQRVGVARALAADPPVLLMDEPFGAVDPIVRGRLQDELLELQATVAKTIVLVTHDIDEALKVGDRIALLNVGGILEQYSSADELLASPANDFVAEFVGQDRSMKRLQLKTVADLAFERGPVVSFDESTAAALAMAERYSTEWVGVTTGEQFAGWVQVDDLDAAGSLESAPRSVPAARVHPHSTLRSAMEIIMTSHTSVAVIDDGGSFGGVITLEMIRSSLDDVEAS
ncbi:MAG: betaine/proline/choline family ABC transporter ATP-binding protein [Acidimicrobiia bacterium]|nr:betaine/proline/choline family ABC transporter ATP-binding protein [Acidimicrobiia bacterium]